mmetsp:Transcript_65251/g.101879  ORF Transcript_65251/g.101879 Transcript_65251/m.101879 type:complete len:105 (-) Transcript_65251:515-829(-)
MLILKTTQIKSIWKRGSPTPKTGQSESNIARTMRWRPQCHTSTRKRIKRKRHACKNVASAVAAFDGALTTRNMETMKNVRAIKHIKEPKIAMPEYLPSLVTMSG